MKLSDKTSAISLVLYKSNTLAVERGLVSADEKLFELSACEDDKIVVSFGDNSLIVKGGENDVFNVTSYTKSGSEYSRDVKCKAIEFFIDGFTTQVVADKAKGILS